MEIMQQLLRIILLVSTLVAVTSAIRCPGKDWYYRNGTKTCYYVINKSTTSEDGPAATNRNFKDAIEECKVRGGRLLTLDNAEELEWIKAKLIDTFYWVGMTYENLKWQWFDGDTFRDYSHIAGLNIPDFPTYVNTDSSKAMRRLSLYNRYSSSDFNFYMESNTSNNGYICKGEWSSRPWCKIEEGWRYHDGRCIKYYPTSQNFERARLRCAEADGGYIVTPSTQREDDLYKSWLRTTLKQERGWMGIVINKKNSTTTVNDITWLDGTPIAKTNLSNWVEKNLTKYVESLPNNQKLCGEVYTKDGEYIWGDYSDWGYYTDSTHDWLLRNSCLVAKPYACETNLNKCPYGWKELGDQCYQFNLGEDRLRTWSEAREDCIKQKGNLVVIQNSDVQNWIEDVIYMDIDFFSGTLHQYWIGLKGSDQSFTWVNSTQPMDTNAYQAWVGKKIPEVSGETCVFINGQLDWFMAAANGYWNATLCTQKMGYICEATYTAEIPPLEVVYPEHTCEPPFEKYHEGCYLFVREKKNRDAAQKHCQDNNSTLAHIFTFGENLWFQSKIRNDSWLGQRIISKSSDGKKWVYKYSDGVTMGSGAYTRWTDYAVQSAQSDPTFNKYCTAIAGVNSTFNISTYSKPQLGYWYHLPCTEERQFVCYHPGKPIFKPAADSHNDPLCGAGWFHNDDNCYQVHESPVPWNLAKQTCQNLHPDSDLLTITSQDEHTFINDLLINNLTGDDWDWLFGLTSPTNYWLDLYSDTNNNWFWPFRGSTNKWHIPLSLTDWAKGEPVNNVLTVAKPRCAYIRVNSFNVPRWYSADCYDNRPFLCKRALPITSSTTTSRPTALPGQVMGCPKDWLMFHDRCIQFHLTVSNWMTANAYCRTMKGELATVRNELELIEMRNFGINSWVGLNSITAPDGPRIFSWSNKVPLTFTPWDTESSTANVSGSVDVNCGALTSKGYAMYSCSQKKSSICEMQLKSVAPDGSNENEQVEGCEAGGFGRHHSCYYFGEIPNSNTREFYTFQEADSFCKNTYAGNLVVINNEDEQRFLNTHAARFGSEFWIGMKQSPNQWEAFLRWITGEMVTHTNWGQDQPESVAGEGCVAISGTYQEESLPGDWYVDKCSARKYALCEVARAISVPPRPTFPTTPKPTGCPNGWDTKETLSSCYKAYVGEKTGPIVGATWEVAERFCQNFRGGHLVSVASEEEQGFIDWDVQPLFQSGLQYWIGLRRMNYLLATRWSWSDFTPYTVNHFHPSIDHSDLETTICVAMESGSGKWIKQNCQQAHGWMCEIPKGTYTEGEMIEEFPTASPINTTCGEATEAGEWYFDKTVKECMYFSKQPNTWTGAKEDCQKMESNLVTIMNKKHHDWIAMKSSQLSGGQSEFYWIGLYQTDYAGTQFQWADGHASLFRAWEAGQPDPRGVDRCVAQNTRSGMWRDLNCGQANHYICAKSDRVPVPANATVAPDVEHSCYYLAKDDEKKSWDEAHKFCIQLGSELVSIKKSSENDFLLSQTKIRQNFSDFWIGLHQLSDSVNPFYSDAYGWSDNQPLYYLNWHFNEPVSFFGTGNVCVEFLTSKRGGGRWRSAPCNDSKSFVCKARKDPAAPVQPATPTKCTQGYTEFEGNCFSIQRLDEGKDNWDEAQKTCRSIEGGTGELATISDIYENALLHSMLSEHHLKGNHTHRAWIGMKEHFGHFAWDNTCPVVFSNFMDLAQTATTSSCVSLGLEGKWHSEDCAFSARYAICQRRFTPCPAIYQPSANDFCPPEYPSECTRSCYHIDLSTSQHGNTPPRSLSFQEAKKQCENLDGRLASIRTQEDQKCLEKYLEHANHGLWIGLYETANSEGDQVWQWLDSNTDFDAASSYLNWGQNEPANNTNAIYPKACGQMLPNGTWISSTCEFWSGNGYICEKGKIRRSSTRPIRPNTDSPIGDEDGGQGLSNGQTAGIVIGVLIAVALVGAMFFIIKTGRTDLVVSSVRSAGTSIRNVATSGMGRKQNQDDRQRIGEDPNFTGDSYS